MKKTFARILQEGERAERARIEAKLPQWAGLSLEYPGKLPLEQCSGTVTALYKADLLHRLQGGTSSALRIADLTGGLGVDSWAFASEAEAVFYNERNIGLKEAVQRNFSTLGISNTQFHSFDISAQNSDWVRALRDFAPNWIYLDPARRGSCGQKLFRPEDCQPDIISLLPLLREITPDIMVKLSPMADIALLGCRLGENLREVKVVQAGGEVKELLCLFDSQSHSESAVTAVSQGREWSFLRSAESEATARFSAPVEGDFLCEPRPCLLKAGAFRLYCESFGIRKLAPSTHLYVSDTAADNAFFKNFRIMEVQPLSKATMAALGRKYPRAGVSARNIPLTSSELSARMRITTAQAQGIHIFGCTCASQRKLIVCRRELISE